VELRHKRTGSGGTDQRDVLSSAVEISRARRPDQIGRWVSFAYMGVGWVGQRMFPAPAVAGGPDQKISGDSRSKFTVGKIIDVVGDNGLCRGNIEKIHKNGVFEFDMSYYHF
jgi:hypothetical protein